MSKTVSEDKIYRGLVLTLDPTPSEKVKLIKSLGNSRFIYNQLVEEYLKAFNERRKPKYPSFPELREKYEFLKDMESWAGHAISFNFVKTNKANRDKRSKGQYVGKVRFKRKKDHNDSYSSLITRISYNSVHKSESYVQIPKIGKIKFKCKNIKSELLNGKIKSGTVKRTKTGEFKVSLCFEVNKVHEDRKDNKHVGLDFSLRDFFVDSFGTKAPEFSSKRSKMESLQKKIDSLNTTISETINKSKNKRKVSVKVHRLAMKRNKLYEHVSHIQKDYINKLTRTLCQHNELLVLEDLDLQNIAERTSYKDSKTSSKGGNHGKSIGLLQWSYFLQKLEQNAEKFGNVIVYANKYFPSSQKCSKCGEIHPEIKDVANRTLKCKCGNIIDRDYNAALNLLKAGEDYIHNLTLGKDLSEYKAFRCLDYRVTRDSQISELELQHVILNGRCYSKV